MQLVPLHMYPREPLPQFVVRPWTSCGLHDALKQPEIRGWFHSSNLVFIDGGATALEAQLKEDRTKWSEVIRVNKIVAQD